MAKYRTPRQFYIVQDDRYLLLMLRSEKLWNFEICISALVGAPWIQI